jgi:hypothetical protein
MTTPTNQQLAEALARLAKQQKIEVEDKLNELLLKQKNKEVRIPKVSQSINLNRTRFR